jgi:Xaa-Pro aminopeptidase
MAKKLGIKLVDIDKELYAIRAIKERGEIKHIKRAVRITKESVKEVLEEVRPGMREFEVGARLEFKFRSKGSDGAAFPTIVLSGKRSCHPHGLTGKRKILRGDVLLLDCGAKVEGYCADITRTIVIGKMQDNVKKHHDLVKKAQRAAIRSIKPGVVNVTVDAAARKIIKQAGFSIPHGIGHGIGLEVHERPSIAQKGYKGCKEEVLKPGMVFTIEPAIYITGKYGIRIEDDIIVTKNGYRVL